MTTFENECKEQSQWERGLGMWEYTTMPSGLIIPTYQPDEVHEGLLRNRTGRIVQPHLVKEK